MAEPELGGIWRLLPHEATSAEFDRWGEQEREAFYAVRTEGIDFITNSSTTEQRALFAQLEQNRQSPVFGERAAADPELQDAAEQQRQFEELGNTLDREGLQPSPAEFERSARMNEYVRQIERHVGDQIEARRDPLNLNEPEHIARLPPHAYPPTVPVDVTDYITNDFTTEQKTAERALDDYWESTTREHNRALQRSEDLISTPIDPRRQEELDHLNALKQPQHFPLTEVKMTDPAMITQLVDTYWKARLDTPLTDQQKQQQQTLQLASQRQQQRQSEEVDQRQTKLSL